MLRGVLPASLLGLALLLAACGGGGGTGSPTAPANASPTQPTVALPTAPAQFADYPNAVAVYVTETRPTASGLAELFSAWNAPQPTSGPPAAAADLDGDGQDEYVVLISDPASSGPPFVPYTGDVLILDSAAGRYTVAFQASRDVAQFTSGPTLVGADDYNGDGKAEAAFTSGNCDAKTCYRSFYVVGWDGNRYVDLLAQPVTEPWTNPAEITFEDSDYDGAQEIRIPASTAFQAGAGPQRDSILTYDWDGTNYVLAGTEYAASDYLYFAIVDADAAFAAGRPSSASSLYRKAAEDTTLKDWKQESGAGTRDRDELVPYARFRLYLTQLSLLTPAAAEAAASMVGSIGGLSREFPDSLHAQAAQRFAEAYGQGGVSEAAYAAGCDAFIAFLEEHRAQFDAVWDYGSANPKRQPAELCPE